MPDLNTLLPFIWDIVVMESQLKHKKNKRRQSFGCITLNSFHSCVVFEYSV